MATIYLIAPIPVLQCEVGDVYIGSTTMSLRNRWSMHKSHFKQWQNGNYGNCSSYRLFEKYGVNNCTYIEIEQCPLENRKERESYWIGFHNGVNVRKLTITEHAGSHEYWREYDAKRRKNPEYRAKQAEHKRDYYARKKAEKLTSQQTKADCKCVLESLLDAVEQRACV